MQGNGEYQDWIKWTQEKDENGQPLPGREIPPLTRNQSLFAEFILKNKIEAGRLGDMETVFKNIRRYLKENGM